MWQFAPNPTTESPTTLWLSVPVKDARRSRWITHSNGQSHQDFEALEDALIAAGVSRAMSTAPHMQTDPVVQEYSPDYLHSVLNSIEGQVFSTAAMSKTQGWRGIWLSESEGTKPSLRHLLDQAHLPHKSKAHIAYENTIENKTSNAWALDRSDSRWP